MHKNTYDIGTTDFLKINTPAFLFLILIPPGIFCFYFFHSLLRISGIVLIVWGISGCALLLVDYYKRKKKLFVRLVLLNKNRDPVKHSVYLKSTVCGLCILWALKARNKITSKGDTL